MDPLQYLPETLPQDSMKSALQAQLEVQALRKKQLEDELALRLEHAPTQIDWTPLASQLDSMYGGQTSKAAASQLASADRFAKEIRGIEDKMSNVSDNEFNLTLARQEKLEDRAAKAEQAELNRVARAQEKKDDNELKKALKDSGSGKGPDAVDKEYAKVYNDYVTEGGSKTIQSNLGLLEEAMTELASLPDQDKPRASGWLGEKGMEALDPQMVAVKDKIGKAVQGTLKPILGAQFAQKEGEAILSRSFNPRLSPKQNYEKVLKEVEGLRAQAEAKSAAAKHYETNNFSLKGFQGISTASQGSPLKNSLRERMNKLKAGGK